MHEEKRRGDGGDLNHGVARVVDDGDGCEVAVGVGSHVVGSGHQAVADLAERQPGRDGGALRVGDVEALLEGVRLEKLVRVDPPEPAAVGVVEESGDDERSG